jgi:hypothetical protein
MLCPAAARDQAVLRFVFHPERDVLGVASGESAIRC